MLMGMHANAWLCWGTCGSATSAEEGHGADPTKRHDITLGEQLCPLPALLSANTLS